MNQTLLCINSISHCHHILKSKKFFLNQKYIVVLLAIFKFKLLGKVSCLLEKGRRLGVETPTYHCNNFVSYSVAQQTLFRACMYLLVCLLTLSMHARECYNSHFVCHSVILSFSTGFR